MPDYKEMYITLFQSTTRVIEILQQAQLKTEEMYMSAEEPNLKLLDIASKCKNRDDE